MLCKVFEYAGDCKNMQKEINNWFTNNKGIEIVNIFQQGGVTSGEDPGSWLNIVTTIFYRDKF